MTSALLGHTGFVGTTLKGQTAFDDLYHSVNISDIDGKAYDLLVCAAAPAAKWKANADPDADLSNLQGLMSHLARVKAGEFVLISTVDVYRMPPAVDENTAIQPDALDAYGRNRYVLETFVRDTFPQARIVRLPGLFGAGLKKNFIFDLIQRGESEWTHADSVFQFYNMARLWADLHVVRQHGLALVNFAAEPVSAAEVARHSFNIDYTHTTDKPPVRYDMRSIHAGAFGSDTPYMIDKATTFSDIRQFAQTVKAGLA